MSAVGSVPEQLCNGQKQTHTQQMLTEIQQQQ